jgi:hypothetical protein
LFSDLFLFVSKKQNKSPGNYFNGRDALDEKLIQRVLDIEKQAQSIHETALAEALALPVQAEKEAEALIARTRSEAEEEARNLVANAQAKEECAQILSDAEEKIRGAELLSKANFDRAVSYVLARVIGRE